MRAERKKVVELLGRSDFRGIVGLFEQGVPVFRMLQGLSYDKNELVCWRAVEAAGHVAEAMARTDEAAVRNMVRRLVWTLSDECGGMAWSTPEMLAEMAARNPVLLKDIPLIVVHLDEPPFRFGATWAAGRLAESHREDVLTAGPDLLAALGHEDPLVRGAAAWAVGRLKWREAGGALARLVDDETSISLYREGDLKRYGVGFLAEEALARIGNG